MTQVFCWLTDTFPVPNWVVIVFFVMYCLHEWAQGYRDKLANQLVDRLVRRPTPTETRE